MKQIAKASFNIVVLTFLWVIAKNSYEELLDANRHVLIGLLIFGALANLIMSYDDEDSKESKDNV